MVSPDVGGVVRARALAKRLESDLAIIDKRRPRANVAEVMNIIGDVDGRTCVIMDDMVDTAGTLCKAAQALKQHGARRVLAYCTHAVLSGTAVSRLAESELDELVVTDTIPLQRRGEGVPNASVRSRSPSCWPRPCCASATTSRSARCSWNRRAQTSISCLVAGSLIWSESCKSNSTQRKRAEQGTGASRRLRREGRVPGVRVRRH